MANPFGPLFPEIPATTLNELVDGLIYQNSYISTPFQRHMRASGAYDPFGGGAAMQFPQFYAGAQGGAIFPGQDVTVNQVQMITAGLFQPKLYEKHILVNEFSVEVLNTGPEARVSLLEAYISQMEAGIDFQWEGDMFRHGQAAGSGVSDDRLASINGISEAVNDGVTPSWDGNVFPTYSSQARNGAINSSMNSTPVWLGDGSGNPAPPNYEQLLKLYSSTIGRSNLMVTSWIGYTAIAAMFQRQQRYAVRDTEIDWEGIKFEDAMIFTDDIVPSSSPKPSIANLFQTPDGTAPAPGAIQTGQFLLTAAMLANQANSLLPSLGFTSNATKGGLAGGLNEIVVGEPIFGLDVDGWKYRISNTGSFNYYIMEPIRYPQNPVLYTQFMRHAGNFYTPTPRRHFQGYGILG
jgi:hypothetical protein